MSGQPDIALALYDRRMNPPEVADYNWRPEPGAESAYYEAEEGAECPVCAQPKPYHGPSCYIAGEQDAGWRRAIASYAEELPWQN